MMDIIDLEDYEFQLAILSILNKRVLSLKDLAPILIFLLDWGKSNNLLNRNSFNKMIGEEDYTKLKNGKLTFSEFVVDKMNGILSSDVFKEQVREFVEDYVEYDGYFTDLTEIYQTNVGDLPTNFDGSINLYQRINESKENYKENKKNFPELVSFMNPQAFKKTQ
jgi:hypothetical protein